MLHSQFKTLAAGLMACVCVTGLSQSASAQFFSNDTSAPALNGRPPAIGQTGVYDSRRPSQWQNQRRMDDRNLRTNANRSTTYEGAYEGTRQGRCPDGQCDFGQVNGGNRGEGTSYRGRRHRRDGYHSVGYPSRSALTTDWDPANSPIDPATGLPSERSFRHGFANGEGRRGYGRDGNCSQGQCDCPEGQCDCPLGQCDCPDGRCNCRMSQRQLRDGEFRQHRMDPQVSRTPYDEFHQIRRNNVAPQYIPARSPYQY